MGDYYVASNKQDYHVLASREIDNSHFTTAGEFSDYLNAFTDLYPGHYVCMIKSYQVVDINNNRTTHHAFNYMPFEVEENTASVFVGETTLILN